jgi:F-type H+-transporting ATPase subunit c
MKKLVSFLTVVFVGVMTAGAAFAQAEALDPKVGSSLAWAAGIIMAVASGLGTFSQSRAATAALEGIARNPQAADRIQTPLILSLALMESLVIFALVIAFFLQNKI